MTRWDDLVAEAKALGYTIELVEYIESPQTPGFIGQGLGVCIYNLKLIRVRRVLKPEDREWVLEHELVHARNEDKPREWHAEFDKREYADPEQQVRRTRIGDYIWPLVKETINARSLLHPDDLEREREYRKRTPSWHGLPDPRDEA